MCITTGCQPNRRNSQLIGGGMFAIDSCKLPCNASKSWSGTKAEFRQKQKKLEKAARALLKQHRDTDARPDAEQTQREAQAAQAIKAKANKIRRWLDNHDDKPGKGVIQDYDGVPVSMPNTRSSYTERRLAKPRNTTC